MIYADTDSVFIKKPNERIQTNQYEKLLNILRRDKFPISLEHDFKFLVPLPLEASEKIEAFKQYYGGTHEGQISC